MVIAPRRIAALHAPLWKEDAPPTPFVAFAVAEGAGLSDEIWLDPWGGFVAQIIVDERVPESFRRLTNLVRELRPDALTIKPTLLDSLLENELRPAAFAGVVGLVIVSGSDFSPKLRTRADAQLGAPLSEAYGLTEFGLAAVECGARNGLHVDPEILPEIYDAEHNVVLPVEGVRQEGELVLSSTRNTAFPLVRYRTGDLATLSRAFCACGRRTPRLTALSGRLVQNFRLPNGSAISPARFNSLFRAHPLAEFQLVQPKLGAFRLEAEPLPGMRLDSVALVADMRRLVGPNAILEIVIGPVTRAGKFQRYRIEA
jgi:phenylacetate-coenzyme A ligase PaaK-like adenylate-forming protein